MATSGDYLNTFTPDRRLHHILNPVSGVSPEELSSVSVVAPSVCDADALATALMVMGRVKGLTLINRLDGFEALVMTKDGAIHRTVHFPGKV
jgi:FAD:protein FMN transferase